MKKFTVFLLSAYKKLISPIAEHLLGVGCRFSPTCSEYTIDAIQKFGVIKGTGLALKRIFRCHPLSRPRYDPVPDLKH